MSDTPNANAQTEAFAADPTDAQFQFEINGQYIKDFSFESPNAPECFVNPTQPKMDVQVDVQARGLGNDAYEVAIRVQSRATRELQAVFVVDLTYAGIFSLRNIPQNQIQPMLLVECPRLLFPFVRNIIADVTRDGGFPPLLLQPIDFVGLYRRQIQSMQQGQSPATASATPPADPAEGPQKARKAKQTLN
jgi:preprotein translocase subunit SecB